MINIIGKIKNPVIQSKNFVSKFIKGCFLFLLFFTLLFAYLNQPFFESDECEIYLLGHSVANGQLLYKDVVTQHMPVTIYIAAFFSCIGVNTAIGFRICFYGLMSLLWVLMFNRYHLIFGKITMLLYPVIYIAFLSYIGWGYTILSDQLQAVGMVGLLLELLLFAKNRKIDWDNICIISLAIFISFGSAFVSCFAIFFVFVTFVCLEIARYKNDNISIEEAIKKFFLTYWQLLLGVLLPFVFLLIYYIITDSFDDFLSWVYEFNREVYPKYLGYGDNIIQGLFGGFGEIVSSLIFEQVSIKSFVCLAAIIGALYFLVDLQCKTQNNILVLGICLFFNACATRGLYSFHGLSAIAIISLFNAGNFECFYKKYRYVPVLKTAVLVVGMFFLVNYINFFFNNSTFVSLQSLPDIVNQQTRIVDLITEDNEKVGLATLDHSIILESNTLPASVNAACAWVWEWGGDRAMLDYKSDPPRVFLYNPNYAIWGYSILNYAADLDIFINNNYMSLSNLGYPYIYVRNDYYKEAYALLNIKEVSI